MSSGSNITARPEWDRLLSAAQKNNVQEIHRLIKDHNVSPSHANAFGQSALHIACLWGNKEAVEALLSHGANVKAQNRITGATPLHSCVQSSKLPSMNRVECARMLFENGADAHLKDLYDMTALDALDAELERGYDGELDDDYLNKMRQLLEEGGKKELKLIPIVENYDFEGLVGCFQQNNDEENFVEIDERDPRSGRTALWIAIHLLACNDEIISTDQMTSLLHIIKLLLEKGSNPNAVPDKNISDSSTPILDNLLPIYIVCKTLDQEMANSDNMNEILTFTLKKVASLLMSHGAITSPCVPIMHEAARRGHVRTVEFCVETLGIDPNTKGRQGLTSLHFAARSGKVDVVELLLSLPFIDPSLVDDRGKTSLDAAMANDKHDIVNLLKNYKCEKK
jgi:ankyrin repeat protein